MQRSAFVTALRERMLEVRHSKLYKSAKIALRRKGENTNPMKVSTVSFKQ